MVFGKMERRFPGLARKHLLEGCHSYETFLYGNVVFTFPDLAY